MQDYRKEYELEKSRRFALESRLRAIYSNPFIKTLRLPKELFQKRSTYGKLQTRNFQNEKLKKILTEKTYIEVNNLNKNSEKFAVIAHWSDSSDLKHSLVQLIKELISNDFEVILSSAAEGQNIILPEEIADRITVIRKPNIGYDFGSWLSAFLLFPEILSKPEVILTNDSIIGPLGNLESFLESMKHSPFDITAFTDTNKYFYHLQSYFLHFKNQSLLNDDVFNFFQKLPNLLYKAEFVLNYEIELTRVIQGSGLYAGALFPWNSVSYPWENPTLDRASKLLEKGFPFIKREFIRLASPMELATLQESLKLKFPNVTEFNEEIRLIQ